MQEETPYDDDFYQKQIEGSLRSARIVLGMLWERIQPASVLDVGCGRGAWLKACREFGASTIEGFDGDWNRGDLMIDEAITFRNCNLNKPIELARSYDLAIGLDVAEHLEPESAHSFIASLSAASDLVLFSAAYSNQRGERSTSTNNPTQTGQEYFSTLGTTRSTHSGRKHGTTIKLSSGIVKTCFFMQRAAVRHLT